MPEKINKMPEFYMIFFPKKYIFPELGGGSAPAPIRLLRLCRQRHDDIYGREIYPCRSTRQRSPSINSSQRKTCDDLIACFGCHVMRRVSAFC